MGLNAVLVTQAMVRPKQVAPYLILPPLLDCLGEKKIYSHDKNLALEVRVILRQCFLQRKVFGSHYRCYVSWFPLAFLYFTRLNIKHNNSIDSC